MYNTTMTSFNSKINNASNSHPYDRFVYEWIDIVKSRWFKEQSTLKKEILYHMFSACHHQMQQRIKIS